MRGDEELMDAYLAGDGEAFDELFRRYARALLRSLGRRMSPEDARDVVQQTFLQLHRSRHDYHRGAAIRPWIYTIAFNLQRRAARDARRRAQPLNPDRDLPLAAAGGEGAELGTAVRFAVARLPVDQRRVIALHWFQGLPYDEVAETVGASLSAVKVRAHRGYLALRKLFERDGGHADR
jgi:RNA polymerase sigma factor (sigma-70 family)